MLEEIKAHYLTHFGRCVISKDFPEGPCPFSILIFEPSEERPAYTVATLGLAQRKQQTTPGFENYEHLELLVYFPKEWQIDLTNRKLPSTWACTFIFYAAEYMIEKNVFMRLGSVVHTEENRNAAFFRFPYAVYTPPLMEAPAFYPLNVNGTSVEFCTPLLITQNEADFMKTHGFKQLIKEMTERNTYDCIMTSMRRCTFGEQIAQQKAEVAKAEAVAENHLKTGCVVSTVVFLAVCFLIGSDRWQKDAPFGLGIALFVITLIAGIVGPHYYAKSKNTRR